MPWTDESITTDRFVLRAALDGDKPVLIELLTDPEVRRHLGGPVGDDVIGQLRRATVGERPDSFVVAHRDSNAAIGAVSLDRARHELEISYQFVTSVWGAGVATEAVGAVVEWAWAHHPDPSIIAVTQTANRRSVSLLERLGFEHESGFEEFGEPQSLLRRCRPG